MKKQLYYMLPFVVIPVLMLFCEMLDNTELLKMKPYIMGTFLLISSAFFGFFSPSYRNIDYLITLVMPLSMFCFMFIVGFFDESDLGTRFHLSQAISVSFQPIALGLYVAMAIITFIASLKFFRNLKKHNAN